MLLHARQFYTRGEGKRRPQHAAWRDPIILWIDARQKALKEAREKKHLLQIEQKQLEAQGLQAGEAPIVKRGRIEKRRFWAPNVHRWAGLRLDELVTVVRQKVDESVQLRMTSDVPIGCFLSGGLDSSTVLSAMARVSPEPVRTFSIGFIEESFDESPWAELAAQRIGNEAAAVGVTGHGMGVYGLLFRHRNAVIMLVYVGPSSFSPASFTRLGHMTDVRLH